MDRTRLFIVVLVVGFFIVGSLFLYWFNLQRSLKPSQPQVTYTANAPKLTEKRVQVEDITADNITLKVNGKVYSYLLAKPRVYVLYRSKLIIKGSLNNVVKGQNVSITTETDESGIETVKAMVIEDK